MPFCRKCGRQLQQGTCCEQCLPNMVQQPHTAAAATQKPKKKKTGLLIAVIILIIALLAAAAVGAWFLFGDKENAEEAGPWDKLTFTLDEETYTMPFKLSQILDNGFEIGEIYRYEDLTDYSVEETMFEGEEAQPGDVFVVNMKERLVVCWIVNTGNKPCPVEECEVVDIILSERDLPDNIPEDFDADYLEDTYGKPDYEDVLLEAEADYTYSCYVGKGGIVAFSEQWHEVNFISKKSPWYEEAMAGCRTVDTAFD